MTETVQLPRPTWFVGCGNMGGAVIDGWRSGGLDLGAITVIRPSATPVGGTRTVATVREAGPPPQLLVLAFKPNKLDELVSQLRPYLGARTVLVSLLAGVEAGTLRQRFPGVAAVVRAIPNLPVAIRRGVTGLYSPDIDSNAREQINNLFSALGFAIWMGSEAKLAALGSVAGTGPAYVSRFIAALAKAGQQRGLSEEISAVIARETVLGTAWMSATKDETPESIAHRVASPRGTTEAGLAILDRGQALDALIAQTIEAAGRRGDELAAEARAGQVDSGAAVP